MKIKYFKNLTIILLLAALTFVQNVAKAQSSPNLGIASGFALFTANGSFTNVGATTVTGNVGTNVGTLTGFPPGVFSGQAYVANTTSAQASIFVDSAYSFLSAKTCGSVLGTTLGNGQILTPNVYCLGAASILNGNLVLDAQGNPNAQFIFKINGALSTSTFSNVILLNSANLCNVYWQINGAFSLGDYSIFRGKLITNGAITLLEGSSLYGTGLSKNGAISLHNNTVQLIPSNATPLPAAITVCAGQTDVIFSVPPISNASDYIWTLPAGATIISGANTNTISVDFGLNAVSGNITVQGSNLCGNGTVSSNFAVTVNSLPTASIISSNGILNFCVGDSVILSGNTGGIWSNSATTSSVTIHSAGDYYVINSNVCGNVISNHILVTVNPMPTASVISANGSPTFCIGDSITLSGNVGGKWNTNATTSSIVVHTSGNYFVTNTNTCGTVTSNYILVTVNPLVPGADSVCQGQTGLVYSVPAISNATGYIWTLPVGAVITSGANTNSITVDYLSNAVSGNISVKGSNNCGNGTISSYFVTVNSIPTAVVISSAFSPDICVGDSILLTGNVGGIWNNTFTTSSQWVQTAGDYFVTNTNACGSAISNHILVTVNAKPIANAGNDTTIIIGGTGVQIGSPSIGNYTYSWSPALSLNNANIAQPIANPTDTTTYVLTVDNQGCKVSDTVVVNVIKTFAIDGTVSYDNSVSTPLSGLQLYLHNSGNEIIDSTTTNALGYYNFRPQSNGDYTISVISNIPWGGVSSADKVIILRNTVGVLIPPLSGLRLVAGDVNASGTVNAADGTVILRRVAGLINSFVAGDWKFNPDTIHVLGIAVTMNFEGICVGDVNGSYIPGAKAFNTVTLSKSGTIVANVGDIIDIPIRINQSMNIGSVSFFIHYPKNSIEVLSVNSNLNNISGMLTRINNGTISIAWGDIQTYNFQNNDAVFIIKVKVLSTNDPIDFDLFGTNEFTDGIPVAYQNVELSYPSIVAPVSIVDNNRNVVQISNFPNPFTHQTVLNYQLPIEGAVIINMYDMNGKWVAQLANEQQNEGKHSLNVEASNLSSGLYQVRIMVSNESKIYTGYNTILKTK